jgi:hypothetical protein
MIVATRFFSTQRGTEGAELHRGRLDMAKARFLGILRKIEATESVASISIVDIN